MVDKTKLNNIKQSIAEKSKALEVMKKERANAGEDVQKMVDLDMKIEAMQESISSLKAIVNTMEASDKIPEPHTAIDELLTGARSYVINKQAKVQKVEQDIVETNTQLATTEAKLKECIEKGETEAVVTYSESVNSLRKRKDILLNMLEETKKIPTFKHGDLEKEWAAVCDKVSADWKEQITILEMLTSEYEAAVNRFEDTYNQLIRVRNEIKSMGREHGLEVNTNPILSVGVDAEKLSIQKTVGLKVNALLERSAVFGDRDLL